MPTVTDTLPGIPGARASSINPGQSGWRLLHLVDGSVMAAFYGTPATASGTGGAAGWQFGTIGEPAQDVVSYTWLGSTIKDIGRSPNTFSKAISGLNKNVQAALIGALDSGGLKNGQPVMYGPNGQTKKGTQAGNTPPKTGDVVAVSPSLPDPAPTGISLPSVSSLFGVFASMGFWKGIGLVLAGAAILIFAAIEFKNMAV
jgi:hypothetical protein